MTFNPILSQILRIIKEYKQQQQQQLSSFF